MGKKRRNTTILNIGDRADYDSYKKFHKERRHILDEGFDYKSVHYNAFLKGKAPEIKTGKVIVFFFFPFDISRKGDTGASTETAPSTGSSRPSARRSLSRPKSNWLISSSFS